MHKTSHIQEITSFTVSVLVTVTSIANITETGEEVFPSFAGFFQLASFSSIMQVVINSEMTLVKTLQVIYWHISKIRFP